MVSKRRGHDDQSQRSGGDKRPRRHKHLYVVLDDWENGFSIHKIDPDSLDGSDSDDDSTGVAGQLPEPPVLRLEKPVGDVPHVGVSFAAMGTKIFVFMNQRCALVYDTETAVMAVGPHAPAQMVCGFGITVPAGETLYALSYRFSDKEHSFQAMSWAPTAPDAMHRPTEGWSWRSLPAGPPSFTHDQCVTSYALHPDGHTIFMTTAHRHTPGHQLGTYSFNTKDSVWRYHGEWGLPFVGEGYFDSELDAWVGLHQDGYICSCQVASRSPSTTQTMQLDWQVTKDKLFFKDLATHMDASLTYMGRSQFCLIERVEQEGREEEEEEDDSRGCVLHLTMFGLKCNHKGELRTTNRKSTQSYLVSSHEDYFSPVAFWM